MRSLRRLMANDIAYGLVLLVFVAAVVAWVYWPHGHAQTVVRTQTTVLVEPPSTPLPRDSGPKNNPRASSPRRNKSDTTTVQAGVPTARPQNRPSPSTTAPKPAATHKRPAAPQKPTTGGQAPQPAPAQPRPPVSATVPAPVTVCTKLAAVNC